MYPSLSLTTSNGAKRYLSTAVIEIGGTGKVTDRSKIMHVYVVLQDENPCYATLDEETAISVYNDKVVSGSCRHATVLSLPANSEDGKVLLEAAH